MTTTFGEVSWNEASGGDNKGGKDVFLRLDEGSNELRIVTQPYQYLVHKYKKDPEDKKDFGQKIYCSAIHGSCPVCALGDKAKTRWLLGVIVRKTNAYKILDVGYAVFQQIRKLAQNATRWGDPAKYDIDIVVDKNGGATGYYSVQPISKEPLSAGDQLIKDNADLDDLKRRVTPPTPENVQKRLDKINGVVSNGSTNGNATAKPAAPAPVDTIGDDDLEESFPSYEAQA